MQVYDLAWSPTGEYIIAGSTDNTARIFDANDGTKSRNALLLLGITVRLQGNVFEKLPNILTTFKELLGIL